MVQNRQANSYSTRVELSWARPTPAEGMHRHSLPPDSLERELEGKSAV